MTWRFVVADGVEPAPSARAALEAAAAERPGAVLLAAVVEGDEAWPRILDKEEAIEACRYGLVALRAVQPGVLLVPGEAPRSFADCARLLTEGRGYLVPAARGKRGARGERGARAPAGGPLSRGAALRLAAAPFWTREERLWQLFRLGRRP